MFNVRKATKRPSELIRTASEAELANYEKSKGISNNIKIDEQLLGQLSKDAKRQLFQLASNYLAANK